MEEHLSKHTEQIDERMKMQKVLIGPPWDWLLQKKEARFNSNAGVYLHSRHKSDKPLCKGRNNENRYGSNEINLLNNLRRTDY